jgi:hypothetical protein
LVHHHQHEDPYTGPGITNWVYVKLHNGGNAFSGDIEVYYTDSSISMSWPTGWTLIDSKNLNIAANSTTIAEIQWTNLPPAGDTYCLVARWNCAADPMHTPEGTSISTNARQNNNIIWKNITIIDAPSGDAPDSAEFLFNNMDKYSFIRIQSNDEYPNKAFTKFGILTMEFDRKSQDLLKNWKSDTPDTDLVRKGNVFIIKGSKVDLKNLPFGKEHRGKIKITFQALKKTPKKIYYLDVSHMRSIRGKESEIGRVAFEIDTQLK